MASFAAGDRVEDRLSHDLRVSNVDVEMMVLSVFGLVKISVIGGIADISARLKWKLYVNTPKWKLYANQLVN